MDTKPDQEPDQAMTTNEACREHENQIVTTEC